MKIWHAIEISQNAQWGIAVQVEARAALVLQMHGISEERAARIAEELNRHEQFMAELAASGPKTEEPKL